MGCPLRPGFTPVERKQRSTILERAICGGMIHPGDRQSPEFRGSSKQRAVRRLENGSSWSVDTLCAALVDRGGPSGLPKVKMAQRTTGKVWPLVMATSGRWSDPWRTLDRQGGSPGRWIAPAGGCGVDVVLCCSTTYRRRACRSCSGMAWMSRRGVSTWRCVDVGVPFARTLRRPPPSWPSWHVMVRHRAETSDTALSSTDTP